MFRVFERGESDKSSCCLPGRGRNSLEGVPPPVMLTRAARKRPMTQSRHPPDVLPTEGYFGTSLCYCTMSAFRKFHPSTQDIHEGLEEGNPSLRFLTDSSRAIPGCAVDPCQGKTHEENSAFIIEECRRHFEKLPVLTRHRSVYFKLR